MLSRKRKSFLARTILVAIVSMILLALRIAVNGILWSNLPADDEMIRNFETDRPVLEKLVQMKKRDYDVYAFGRSPTSRQEDGKAPVTQREKQYWIELAKTHVRDAIVQYDENTILFCYYAWDFPSIDGKGYAFLDKLPAGAVLVPNLDGIDLGNVSKDRFVFRHVVGPWYLYICATP